MSIVKELNEFLLGPPLDTDLPVYVKSAIKEQQHNSEMLISWVQLIILILFGTLYSVSPKAFPANVMFTPVPWALTLYLLFSLIRLALSYKRLLSNWFLILSIVADITLLMVLIWSFHVQYQQPASFYLKAPTLLYIFIFIALRTLRFEAKYVLIAGIVAAIGWLTLLVFALLTSPAGSVTRDYLLYMTSNHILIGAEIDKIVSILVVTGVLTIAVIRAQRFLVKSIAETLAIRELSKFFAPEIAENIIHSGNLKPGYGEIRQAAILHCDIRGFTEMSKHRSPKETMQLLTDYQSRTVKIIRKYKGTVDKFLGDGILASFNAVNENKHFAANALRALEKIIVAHAKSPFRIGVTVTSGPVVLGIVGDALRLEYTVIGDAVNLAAKLDKQCKIEHCQALTTVATLQEAISQGFEPATPVKMLPGRIVENIVDPIDLVEL